MAEDGIGHVFGCPTSHPSFGSPIFVGLHRTSSATAHFSSYVPQFVRLPIVFHQNRNRIELRHPFGIDADLRWEQLRSRTELRSIDVKSVWRSRVGVNCGTTKCVNRGSFDRTCKGTNELVGDEPGAMNMLAVSFMHLHVRAGRMRNKNPAMRGLNVTRAKIGTVSVYELQLRIDQAMRRK